MFYTITLAFNSNSETSFKFYEALGEPCTIHKSLLKFYNTDTRTTPLKKVCHIWTVSTDSVAMDETTLIIYPIQIHTEFQILFCPENKIKDSMFLLH